MTEHPTDAMIEAISKLSLATHEECGGFIAAITGSGVDLLAQGSTREEALKRLAMQSAAELVFLKMEAAKPSTPSSGCVWLDLERPCQTEGCTICRPSTPRPKYWDRPFGDAGDAIDFACDHCASDDAMAFLEDWRMDRAGEWQSYMAWLKVQQDGAKASSTPIDDEGPRCASCGKPMSRDCAQCQKDWAS